jgi:hypothetical protein
VLVEKADPSSQVLAGKSTLNRLELTKETASRKERYKKIVLDHGAVDRLLGEVSVQAHRETATQQHPAKPVATPNSNKLIPLLPSCERSRLGYK